MALKPIYARFNPEINGMQWGLSPEDFHKVTHGFACAKCLNDFRGLYRLVCPTCGERTSDVKPLPLPDEWRKQAE